jgi:hypothetical protein
MTRPGAGPPHTPDAPRDPHTPDAHTPGKSPDASPDASPDRSPDAPPDTSPDRSPDAPPDKRPAARSDARPDALIERYLARLRRRLREIPEPDARDILDEIRSHLLDRAAASGAVTADAVARAIDALGPPEDLASAYLLDDLVTRARLSRSPWLILRGLFWWASLSLAGIAALAVSLVGYVAAGAFALCALLKPIHPDTAGLWLLPDPDATVLSLRLGFGTPPAGSRELLGWWIVPLGVLLAIATAVITVRLGLACMRRLARPARERVP